MLKSRALACCIAMLSEGSANVQATKTVNTVQTLERLSHAQLRA